MAALVLSTGRKAGKEKDMNEENKEQQAEVQQEGNSTYTPDGTKDVINQQHSSDDGQTEEQESQQEGKEKLFTQEEVNAFIQSRISRMKAQAAKESAAEYEQKLAELEAREIKILVREKLHEREMPKELADIIACTDANDIDAKLDILQKCGAGKRVGFVKVGAPPQSSTGFIASDPYRKVMGLEND